MSRLVLCQSCHRHVRSEEASCPFCSATLAEKPARASALGAPLTRAALLIGSAAAGLAAAGCGDDSDKKDAGNEQDGGTDAARPGPDATAQPAYGVSIEPDASTIQPAYGVPVPPPDAGGMAQPAYGVAIEPDAGHGTAQPAYGVPVGNH